MNAIWVCPRCDEVYDRDKIDGEYVERGDCPSCRIEKTRDEPTKMRIPSGNPMVYGW